LLDPRVEKIFRQVKEEFKHTPDGPVDNWAVPSEHHAMLAQLGVIKDDCDGFALRCRELLDGLAVDNRLVIVRVRSLPFPVNGHMVCTVGGWVLDNRCSSVISRDLLDYDFLIQSGFHAGDDWHMCEI